MNTLYKKLLCVGLLSAITFSGTWLDKKSLAKEAATLAMADADFDQSQIAPLLDKPLYEFSEQEVDLYLKYLQATEPDLRKRILHLARKNIGQPYELYLLGEMPFEHYDPQPIYCLGKSDCLVYSEHTYAMALSDDWPGFMKLLQRIRYRDGQIGVATRNHYTEPDWNPSNRWLVQDVTEELAGENVLYYEQRIDRQGFLKKRYELETEIPVETHRDSFVPIEHLDQVEPHLKSGDFVNIVRGRPAKESGSGQEFRGSAWVGHVGLIALGPDGKVNLIHSARPKVREQPLDEYVTQSLAGIDKPEKAGKPRLLGFKFLRLQDDPLANLRKIDGPQAPVVKLPGGKSQLP